MVVDADSTTPPAPAVAAHIPSPVPMPTGLLSALKITQTVVSFNNWMQNTTKLNELIIVVTSLSTSQSPPINADQI